MRVATAGVTAAAAGLVTRTRTGRSVNYVATGLGDALLSPDAPR